MRIGKTERRLAPLVSLLVTALFFLEYIPPFKRVHFFSDIEGFHYPMLNYMFKSLREGRFPEWDPAIYCGVSFAGNIQASSFYPPTWLLMAANTGRYGMLFKSVEFFAMAHVALALLLCYLWLRRKGLAQPACALAAAGYAFGNYAMTQSNHLGVIAGHAWFPLGFLAIDESLERRSWQPLWKLAAASALCFLAGYPPIWFVFAVLMGVYALASGGWRTGIVAGLALGFSLLVAAVQFLPTMEASAMKQAENAYGAGVGFRIRPEVLISHFLPNIVDQSMGSQAPAFKTGWSFYLGAPLLLGFLWWLRRPACRPCWPGIAVVLAGLIGATNPGNLVLKIVETIPRLGEVCRSFNFLVGIPAGLALVAAVAFDHALSKRRAARIWAGVLAAALLVIWTARQIYVWLPGGPEFAYGWRSFPEPLTTLLLMAFGCWALARSAETRVRTAVIASLLLTAAVEYKVYGTSRRFNAVPGDVDHFYAGDARNSGPNFTALDTGVYRRMLADREHRVTGFPAGELRHYGLRAPGGLDPMMTVQYLRLSGRAGHVAPDGREYEVDPQDVSALRFFGIRYVFAVEDGETFRKLERSPEFQRITAGPNYFQVFELRNAEPVYRWEGGGTARQTGWTPEIRDYVVDAVTPGRLVLKEQLFPGWRVSVDGTPSTLERQDQAFQAVRVPAGKHRVQFRFRSSGMRVGGVLSALALAGLFYWRRSA